MGTGAKERGHAFTFILFLSSNSLDWSLTIPSSLSMASMVVDTVTSPWARASLPFCESCRSASTGSSSVGGRGKGGVRVGDREDQEVPGEEGVRRGEVGERVLPSEDTPLEDGDIWPLEASELRTISNVSTE